MDPTALQATQVLRDDHKRLQGLFRQFETLARQARDEKRRLVDEIFALLEIHAEIEENIFYPAVAAAGDENVRGLVEESLQDHKRMNGFLQLLLRMNIHGEFFDARFSGIINETQDHIAKEEREILPIAEKLLSSRLGELGGQMMSVKEERLKTKVA
jgi:hemerythrin-like domain-containing protein